MDIYKNSIVRNDNNHNISNCTDNRTISNSSSDIDKNIKRKLVEMEGKVNRFIKKDEHEVDILTS